jgi:hypothetical protein
MTDYYIDVGSFFHRAGGEQRRAMEVSDELDGQFKAFPV